ncbi:uncharacterized protein BX664DRAFT_356981 [Halteromyces radiatus]|uniref:uncharacterized protein n=1 Tax=Halteromyces radiatus TaxID=101107 RepID=UPI00221F0217|nr:uncharacterized protein BX664DRAFT_356981 [Halteromyces radiatus]KAI8097774.1 hypothetical protein BX664DRAFT_356981 [Halteromyces radiatus]
MRSNTKLILSLINRVAVRLPINSGRKIESLEHDPIVQQTVAAIIELSTFKLSTIANALGSVLENVSKHYQPTTVEYTIPIDVLQSQLFILRLLSACMQHHWKSYREQASQLAHQREETDAAAAAIGAVGADSSPRQSLDDSSTYSVPRSMYIPPLDDALVSFILLLMNRFLIQVHQMEEANDNDLSYDTTMTAPSMDPTLIETMLDIYKVAGKVLYYVSASNWSFYYAKIKAAVQVLGSIGEGIDTNPPDIRMLECSCLTRPRLHTVLTELSPYYLHMKRQGKLLYSKMIRRAIWRWIETYPSEFEQVCASDNRLLGGSEILFDMCSSSADTSKKKAIMWPLQTILLSLSPDLLLQAFLDNPSSQNRRTSFLATLRKSLKSSRTADIAALCYVDLCKAATYIRPNDDSVLHHIAADIDADLREKIWNATNDNTLTTTHGYSVNQQVLTTDYLLARLRLDTKSTLISLVPTCLGDRAPIRFKLALVKSCLAIADEDNHLAWNPSLENMYDPLCSILRKLFIQAVGYELRPGTLQQQRASLDRRGNTELIQDILRLYKTDPLLALLNNEQGDENGTMMLCIANLFQHQDHNIRQNAVDCLSKLHSIDAIPSWGSSTTLMSNFWSISSQVIFSLARQMLDEKQTEDGIKSLLNLVMKLLKSRAEFLRKQMESTNEGVRERLQASISLEIALLVCFCSPNPDICSDSIRCLGLLCDETEFGNDGEDPQLTEITYICNLPIYFDLASEDSVFLGRKAQQKRIRKYLRMMNRPTPGNLAAWEEVYKRWKGLMKHIRQLDDINSDFNSNSKSLQSGNKDRSMRKRTEIDDEKPTEWQNYTGFLASLGICCLANEDTSTGYDTGRSSYSDESTVHSNGPIHSSSPSEPYRMVDRFMAEMTELLVSDNVFIREGAKDALGNDLSPTLYANLFRHLMSMTGKLFMDNEPVGGTTNILFVEQAALVLKLILERLVDPSDCLMNIEFGAFVLHFTRYVDALPDTYVNLRVKINICNLVEACLFKKEQIVIGNETRLRNQILTIIKGWTSDSMTTDVANMMSQQQNDKLQRDLDQACLRAMVQLLHQLPLQPLEPVRTTDAFQVKSRLFYGYFEFFLKLLSRCGQTESSHGNKDTTSTSKEMAPLKNYTVAAMTNLLNANIDAGLKFSLAMGYHGDPSTRTAFIQVLTNILNQGVEFDTLAENVTTDRYDRLLDMLVESDMEIALSLCEVCPSMDTTGLAEVLLACFESRRKELMLMKAVIEKEVATTEQEATLLRGTTMGIKLISTFAKTLCWDYLRKTLQPVLEAINEWNDDEIAFELDPRKFASGDDLNRNKANVIRTTELLLDAICTSADDAPKAFRQELHLIVEAVRKRFPEAKYTAVGGVVILRLFGPAIVSPEHAGFARTAIPRNNKVRKLLLQATRVIQNLASNILFGSKETHMIVLNDFLTNNIYRVTSFLREISSLPKESDNEELCNTVRMDQNGYIRLHRYLSDNIERMSRDLSSRRAKNSSTGNTQSLLDLKRTMDRLSNLLAQLGQPSEISDYSVTHSRRSTNTVADQQFNEFMKRNAHSDTSGVSSTNFFFLGGTSKAGHPVFYLISRNIDAEYMDFELATYYMLKVMEPHLSSPFELLFDLTYFDSGCEFPTHWLSLFFQLIGNWLNDYLVCLNLYNPNTHLRSYMRRFPRAILNKLVKRIRFVLTLSDLYERIPPSELRIPKYTAEIEKEPATVFYPVTRQTNLKSTLPVTVKISTEHIQIITVRPIDLVSNFNTVLKDIYHISVLEDIKALPNSKQDNVGELSFKYEHGKAAMVLSSPKRDSMLALLRYNKQNYERNKPGGIHERPLRPSDVPGRLLSMALLNIGHEDPAIRLASYNLLHSLSITFRFDLSNQLLNAQDLCIPANSTDFLISISERLAASEPQLTLDFLSECLIGFHKSSESMRQLCLDYASPWLRNLAIFIRHTPDDHNKNLSKATDIIRLMIELTVSYPDMYKHVQAKIWKPLGKVDDIINVILDSFIQFAVEHGVGSPQAEAMADTFVTLSSVTVRGKVISRLRKVLQCTSLRPCRHLTDHPAWTEIIILLRFILMLSFNNASPVKPHLPELFHIVSLLVGNGSVMVRASVHELVVNIIHTLCTATSLPDDQVQKLHFILNDLCDSKNRIYFGLTKHHTSSLTINSDTMTDHFGAMNLSSLESMIRLLLEALHFGAPSIDIANMWRARWMGLITSTAFQFNPAIQPRSFVALGCLATDEVDDDLIYQILVALRGALAIFNETDASLIISIMMCLSNIIDNLPSSSRYLHPIFWLAISLVEMNHPATFKTAVRFMQSVLRALDRHKFFIQRPMAEFLLETRAPLSDVSRELDFVNGISFDNHFSFAVAGILFKGVQQQKSNNNNNSNNNSNGNNNNNNGNNDSESDMDVVYECLTTFLEIDCKRCLEQQNTVEAKSLGYLVGLLPLASRNNALRELLRLAGINDVDLDGINFWSGAALGFGAGGGGGGGIGMSAIPGIPNGTAGRSGLIGHLRIFDALEIPDNTTALLLVSFLVTMLNTAENEAERLFLYSFLSEASVSIPEVFALVYESLLPKMNQMAISSQNYAVIDAVKGILMTACSEPAFYQPINRKSQKAYLDELGFSALGDPSFGASKTNVATNAQLISKLLERITD